MKSIFLIAYVIHFLTQSSTIDGIKSVASNMLALPPNISLIIEPAKPEKLTPFDIKVIMSAVKLTIKEQIDELERELMEIQNIAESNGNFWQIHGSPIYYPPGTDPNDV